jgi:3-oxoacyl-[acyl-carrier protein] reductase
MLFQADLSQDKEVQEFVRRTKDKFGRVDVLINMIGPFSEAKVLEQSPAAWRDSIELNLNVVYSSCYHFQKEIANSQGQVINFGYAGIENLTAWANATSYAAAKAGLGVLTKSMAQAMAPYGVRVNAICPGWIDSGHFDDSKKEKILASIPIGRIGRPEEVSELLQWLIFDSPTYITGALIPIGGAIEF